MNKYSHPKMFTVDGVEITPGKRLYNYYDGHWGYIDPRTWGEFETKYKRQAPDGEYFDGWFRLYHEDSVKYLADAEVSLHETAIDWDRTYLSGRYTLLNGERMSSYEPEHLRSLPNLRRG